MSTAIVSAFYEVENVLYQAQKSKNCSRFQLNSNADRCKAVGSPVLTQSINVNRNMRINSTSVLNKLSQSPPTNSMISYNSHQQQQNCSQQKLNRKLDRSVSEPAERHHNALNNQNTVRAQLQANSQAAASGANVSSSRYKTELCRPYEESGHCKYGDKCQFAHGSDELRNLPRHPKYKTERCRTFHTSGFCPYGPRCHFIHNEDELKLSNIKQRAVPEPRTGVHTPSPQQPVPQRPRALSINSFQALSLGSTGDSPASSVTDSPSMSPTFGSDDLLDAFSPTPASAPAAVSSAFTFNLQDLQQAIVPGNSPVMTPLNVQTDPLGLHLVAASLNQQNNNFSLFQQDRSSTSSHHDVFGCPSPPDSLCGDSDCGVPSTCGSPLDMSRGLRLPIFSQFHD